MKEINPNFREIHGYPIMRITFSLSSGSGMCQRIHERTVEHKPGVLACGSDEFISWGSRHALAHVYELAGVGKVTSLPSANSAMSMFCYCMPDNVGEVVDAMKTKLIKEAYQRANSLKDIARDWESQANTARALMTPVNEADDE